MANLQSLTNSYRAAGAKRFIIAGVIKIATEIPRYLDALGSEEMFICRPVARGSWLVARPEVLESRLRRRDNPAGLLWHLDRVDKLSNVLEAADLDDLVWIRLTFPP